MRLLAKFLKIVFMGLRATLKEGLVSGHPEDAKKVSITECPESGLTATTDTVVQCTNVYAR